MRVQVEISVDLLEEYLSLKQIPVSKYLDADIQKRLKRVKDDIANSALSQYADSDLLTETFFKDQPAFPSLGDK